MIDKKNIGLFGGTFDPIHIGHLATAENVRTEYGLDKVLFIPANLPPHKQSAPVTPAKHRYLMAMLATYSNPHFTVSAIELERAGPSYSIDTVQAMIEKYGQDTNFYFITGADTIKDLPTWKSSELLLNLCDFVVAARPGCMDTLNAEIENLGPKGKKSIHKLTTPELEISSTDIRNRIKQGKSIKYIVPENVEAYIIKEKLYLA